MEIFWNKIYHSIIQFILHYLHEYDNPELVDVISYVGLQEKTNSVNNVFLNLPFI